MWTRWLAPEFTARPCEPPRSARRRERAPGCRRWRALLRQNFEGYLVDDLLVKADRCSMANALEVALAVSGSRADRVRDGAARRLQAVAGRARKVILRDAFADMLPAPIQRRGKMGFGVPLARWFRGRARGLRVGRAAGRRTRDIGPTCRVPWLERSVSRHLERAGEPRHRNYGRLLCFERWLQMLPELDGRRAVGGEVHDVPDSASPFSCALRRSLALVPLCRRGRAAPRLRRDAAQRSLASASDRAARRRRHRHVAVRSGAAPSAVRGRSAVLLVSAAVDLRDRPRRRHLVAEAGDQAGDRDRRRLDVPVFRLPAQLGPQRHASTGC